MKSIMIGCCWLVVADLLELLRFTSIAFASHDGEAPTKTDPQPKPIPAHFPQNREPSAFSSQSLCRSPRGAAEGGGASLCDFACGIYIYRYKF